MGFFALAAAGCGPSAGSVSGNITFEGKGIPVGTVVFVPANGADVSGSIYEGKYLVDKVPPGEAKVFITVPTSEPAAGGMPAFAQGAKIGWEKKGPPKGAPVPEGFDPSKVDKLPNVKIPAQYTDAATTPLKYTVVIGKQEKDFELK